MDDADKPSIVVRGATPADGKHVWRLVGDSEALEQNTAYAYLLLCDHFGDTSVVAERDGEIVGMVMAYRPPREPNAVFVWQVGVDKSARGQGLASRLLDAVVRLPGCRGVDTMLATVAPSNEASRALFGAFARRHDAPETERAGFTPDLFPGDHEAEPELRIGPFHLTNTDPQS